MWAEMFQTSPQFAIYHAPPEILVAIERCLRGDQDPWKGSQIAIGDGPSMLPITNQPDRTKKPTKRPKTDPISEATGWSMRTPWQDWSTFGGQWPGWVDCSSPASKSGWRDDCMHVGASAYDTSTEHQEGHSEYDSAVGGTEDDNRSRNRRAASAAWDTYVVPPWRI